MKTQPSEKSEWVGVCATVRQRYIANEMTIPHPGLVRVLAELKRGAARCKNEGRGAAMLVLAGSGCGKSHLKNLVARHRPPDHSKDVSIYPVIHFAVPSAPTQKAMGAELIRALEQPKATSGSAQELFSRGIKCLNFANTEIIMIDDVQDIPERRRSGGIMQVGNWLRDLIDESKCLVVLFGTPAARQITDANAQLRRRVRKQMTIRYFDINTELTVKTFKRFLHELDKRLPLVEMSRMEEPEFMRRIYWATSGIADYIFELMSEAVGIAVACGRERIQQEDLEKAFGLVFQDGGAGVNPFSIGGPERLLNQPNEPFYNWFDSSNPHPDGSSERVKTPV